MIYINFFLTYFEIYLIFVNITTFILFTYDKVQAISANKNVLRVPEINLLLMSMLGGTIGAIVSMLLFRHKIKKLSFIVKLLVVIIIQTASIYLFTKYQFAIL
ncbi:MAG: DUF1294 domain-containing protein [Campylobacterota bacterium]|nr:DUF1294 domain-containing protein [Campylobacterota bacterium]